MNLENQCCTLEQAKKLFDLGLKQESAFYWKENKIQIAIADANFCEMIKKYLPSCNEYYSAFTVSEMNEILPIEIKDNEGITYQIVITKDFDYDYQKSIFTVGYYNFHRHKWYYGNQNYGIATTTADLLIKLIEHKKIKISN